MILPEDVAQHAQTNEVDSEEAPKSMAKDSARYTIQTTATQNATQTVIAEYLQMTLIRYAQWPGLATVKQDRPYHRVIDAALCAKRNFDHNEVCGRLKVACAWLILAAISPTGDCATA